jgi:signal transduction histidine kinase/CheY-like chemotaxis protein
MGSDDEPPASREFRVVLPDGRFRWLASRSTLVRDEQGRPLRFIGVNWDVTDRRTAEAERHEREIAQRESLAKSKFLARMSHELRTPLNAVLGFTQLLLQAPNKGDPDERQRRLQHIASAGHHLLDLINDVLDLSSLEGGEVQIALQPVPLAPLVAGTLPLLERLLREHQVHLQTGALDAVALGDATRLRQVLLNLLSNAVKYNRPGGRVTVEAALRGGRVVLGVADTGRGMSDQQMRHLFEPFNRLGIERENIEGTGIGLAIVKALVERMGGSVHVESRLGVGSRFELRLADGSALPAAPPPGDQVSRPLPLPASVPRGSLLYIEDNPVNAQIVSELIARRTDLRLEVAPDGISGVERALALRPDLVLLDMQLPDIDGHEVLRRLRAHSATAGIPVIALSANAMPEDIERALRAGLSDYWTKPLDFRVFMASIEQLFGPGPDGR